MHPDPEDEVGVVHEGVGVLVLRHAEQHQETQLDRAHRRLGLRVLQESKSYFAELSPTAILIML